MDNGMNFTQKNSCSNLCYIVKIRSKFLTLITGCILIILIYPAGSSQPALQYDLLNIGKPIPLWIPSYRQFPLAKESDLRIGLWIDPSIKAHQDTNKSLNRPKSSRARVTYPGKWTYELVKTGDPLYNIIKNAVLFSFKKVIPIPDSISVQNYDAIINLINEKRLDDIIQIKLIDTYLDGFVRHTPMTKLLTMKFEYSNAYAVSVGVKIYNANLLPIYQNELLGYAHTEEGMARVGSITKAMTNLADSLVIDLSSWAISVQRPAKGK